MKYHYALAVTFSVMLWVTPAVAQQNTPQSSQSSGSSLNIPDWAQPMQPSSGYSPGSSMAPAETNPPGMPAAPKQVPIDGGLSLLAAAGAGYALYRLRRRRDDDDELP